MFWMWLVMGECSTIRWAFLRMLRRQDFAARVLVIDKELIAAPHMHKRETFYNFVVQLILR